MSQRFSKGAKEKKRHIRIAKKEEEATSRGGCSLQLSTFFNLRISHGTQAVRDGLEWHGYEDVYERVLRQCNPYLVNVHDVEECIRRPEEVCEGRCK